MDRLLAGYRRFRQGRWSEYRDRAAELTAGQRPTVLVIACSDSRVDPAIVFDTAPGQMFTVRNVANLVPPYEEAEGLHGTSAALEYAVTVLNVGSILVLGHADCGGVRAALDGAPAQARFLAPWLALLAPAVARLDAPHAEHRHAALERESVRLSLERLRTFPFVAAAEAQRGLRIEGGVFSVFDGKLELYDAASGTFRAVI